MQISRVFLNVHMYAVTFQYCGSPVHMFLQYNQDLYGIQLTHNFKY